MRKLLAYDVLSYVNHKVQVMNESARKMKDKPPTDVKSANSTGHIPVPSGNSIRYDTLQPHQVLLIFFFFLWRDTLIAAVVFKSFANRF